MSWEAIRGLSKYNKLELWDSERTVKPILLNNITHAAEEARELLPKFNQAVELLRRAKDVIGNSVPNGPYSTAIPEDHVPIQFDICAFLSELEGKQ